MIRKKVLAKNEAECLFCVPSCRGRGLFVGVELVRDRLKLTPAAAEAQEVIYK